MNAAAAGPAAHASAPLAVAAAAAASSGSSASIAGRRGGTASGAPWCRAAAGTAVPPAQPGLREALARVVRTEGWRSLWKGNLVTIIHRIPYSSINFYTYEATSRALAGALPPGSDMTRRMVAGAMAGLVACTTAYPLDLVRTRLAAQTGAGAGYYHGIGGTLRRIVADEGALGLYRGLGATLLQTVPSLALSFTVYETARNAAAQLEQRQRVEPAAPTASGGGSSSSGSSTSSSFLSSSSEVSSRGTTASALSEASAGGGGEWDLAQMLTPGKGAHRGNRASGGSPSSSSSSSSSNGGGSGGGGSSFGGTNGGVGGDRHALAIPPPPPVSAVASLACGCLSGLVTATITFPLDVVRRRMQVEGQGRAGAGASYAGVIRQVLAARGLKGFYTGITAEYCKVVPGVAIAYGSYEAMKRYTQAD